MFHILLGRHPESPPYSRLNQDGLAVESSEKDRSSHISSLTRSSNCELIFSAVFLIIAGATGYFLGTLSIRDQCAEGPIAGTVAQGQTPTQEMRVLPDNHSEAVPIGTTREIFQYNSSFATPPPEDGGPEPIWDSMVPS